MQGDSYLRSQAELCLRIARNIRDETVASKFRAAATQYFLRSEAERVPSASSGPTAMKRDMCAARFANWPDRPK
jgi:hypothetical protein